MRDNPPMRKQITAYLKRHPAAQLLWLSEQGNDEMELPADISLRFEVLRAGLINELGDDHFDCAVLEGLPGELSQQDAESVVAHLRDVQAQRLLWLHEADSLWQRQDLLALGFKLLDKADDGGKLFGYDIDNYKTTPDWLSPKNWANPEKWGKKRW